jgi:hypothetical protein
MPDTARGTEEPFIEVDYAAKVVFTPKHDGPGRPDVRATWQKSQGLWKDHPVFHGMSIADVIMWLRGADSDV